VGQYTVKLVAVNAWGCLDSVIYSFIKVTEKSSLFIPDIFTPNGDGPNDIFKIKSEGISELNGVIFNRWGELLFQWNTVEGGWDGRTASGTPVPDGVYFYIIKAVGSDGVIYTQKGHVTLMR
jgi:gliding motility-associated-like protein